MNNIKTNWKVIIENIIHNHHWEENWKAIKNEYNNANIFPPFEQIFAAFNFFDFEATKVVIIGQDPYYLPGQANGLAFSVNASTKLPKSLVNIYKELKEDLGITRENGDLTSWAKQGVLLLNSSLTVKVNQPNSHLHYHWEIITDAIIKYIDQHLNPVIFVLWGNFAIKKKRLIKNNSDYIISSNHPSPLSAYRGFFGSKPFSKINQILAKLKLQLIEWE